MYEVVRFIFSWNIPLHQPYALDFQPQTLHPNRHGLLRFMNNPFRAGRSLSAVDFRAGWACTEYLRVYHTPKRLIPLQGLGVGRPACNEIYQQFCLCYVVIKALPLPKKHQSANIMAQNRLKHAKKLLFYVLLGFRYGNVFIWDLGLHVCCVAHDDSAMAESSNGASSCSSLR